jgi:MYXO-CTERM domain-containing protein
MRRSIAPLLVGTLTLAIPVLAASNAFAGIEACGNIHVEANAKCEVLYEGGCTAQCEPIRFEAACAAELEVGCSGQCNATFEATCVADCSGSCEAECNVDPPSFSCTAQCNADCQGSCDASCAASGNQGECRASCEATCSADCDANCQGTAGSADCQANCQACCEGSCTAEANMSCQIDCQASGYVQCKADLQGGCEIACESPEGALFCDGNYVDHGGNLEECIASLQALLNIQVEGYANAECADGTCTAEAGVNCTACAVAPGWSSPVDERSLAALAAGLGLVVAARRRRRA